MSEIKNQLEELLPAIKTQQDALTGEIKERQDALAGEIKERQKTLAGEMKAQQETFSEDLKRQQDAFAGEMKKQLEEAFRQSEDSFHKESVKVYRNVQAAMTEELGKQTEALTAAQKESGKKQRAVLPLTVIILLLLLADIAIQLSNYKLF